MIAQWKSFLYISLICLLAFCGSCQKTVTVTQGYTLFGQTMGTTYSVRLESSGSVSAAKLVVLKRKIDEFLEGINDSMSTYRKTSTISKFNSHRGSEPFFVGRAMATVVQRAIEIGKQSHGAFDITIGPVVDLWGFDKTERKLVAPASAKIQSVKSTGGLDKISVADNSIKKSNANTEINLSGIAKGYAVDGLFELVKEAGYSNIIAEIGGEIRASETKGNNPWKLGINDPRNFVKQNKFVAIAKLKGGALATSGTYLNFFEYKGKEYSHLIDPRTGYPVKKGLASVSIVAPDCMSADAWGTAAMVLGEKAFRKVIAKLPDVAALFVYESQDGKNIRITKTDNFPT